MPIVLTLVIPAAFIVGGMIPRPAILPCELSKYRTAALLAPRVLAAYTEAAALSPRLTDQNWTELGAFCSTGVNGMPPR